MAIILDADVLIRGEKGAFDLKTWLQACPDEVLEVAAITVAELWHGVRRLGYLGTVLGSLSIIPYTEQTAREHARIWEQLEAVGKRVGYYDLIVAATALERGSQVATFNRRHFELIPRLTVIEPR